MTEFLTGFILCYIIGAIQVYRERKEYAARTGAEISPVKVAALWPLAVGPKW